ncbi:Ethylene-responsive transcription factor CRF1 [Hordeum vulgare]|nr:Ethylene-responsive transcription factor CRF1 [Hordeum vulgare]
MRPMLDTFETAEADARAYDATTWWLLRPSSQNFPAVWTREEAQARTPPPRLIIEEDRHIERRRDRRLLVAEMDEQAMKVWPERFRRMSSRSMSSGCGRGLCEPRSWRLCSSRGL